MLRNVHLNLFMLVNWNKEGRLIATNRSLSTFLCLVFEQFTSLFSLLLIFSYSRGQFHHWCFQVKIKAAANVSYVADEMLHACGGVGYKKELGKSVRLRSSFSDLLHNSSNLVGNLRKL